MDKLKQIRAVLIDCSGTLHVDQKAIPNSVEALVKLKNSPVKYILATNTTKESKKSLLAKLKKLGFQINPEDLFTSLTAVSSLVKRQNLKPFLVLEDDAKKEFVSSCDINIPLNEADSLVIGLANKKFNYKEMNEYFKFLFQGNRSFIGINKSRYFQTKNGPSIGPGAFIKCLEYATSKKAQIIGKPNEEFFRQAIDQIMPDLPFTKVAMIGDDLKDDVIGAQKHGMLGILVRTGKYCKEDETKENHKPDLVFDSVVEAINKIIEVQGK